VKHREVSCLLITDHVNNHQKGTKNMKFGQIPGINKPVSRLVQGTIMCNTREQDKTDDLLDMVFQHGINTFDTAHVYGSGECERSVGAWFNRRGLREEIVLIGKGAHLNQDRQRVTPFDISADIHDSLARFNTDYIDLYMLHRDDPSVPVGPIVERLQEHKDKGHIHAFGGSNWTHERIAAANTYAKKHGLTPFVVSSPHFSLADQAQPPWSGCVTISGPSHEDARAWYQKRKMPLFTWSSLAGGFFSGRFRPDNLDTFKSYLDKLCVDVYCFGENWGRLERAEELAVMKRVSLPQIALAYVLNQSQDIYALIACWTSEEVADNVQALEIELSIDELKWLEG
jgi:aryl-alcohol dehydrogenase-like predicted oxidoreductase